MKPGLVLAAIVWAAWSGTVAAGVIYLGANTEPFRAKWPIAGVTGAALGGVAGVLISLLTRNRSTAVMLSVPVGLVLGIGASLLYCGK